MDRRMLEEVLGRMEGEVGRVVRKCLMHCEGQIKAKIRKNEIWIKKSIKSNKRSNIDSEKISKFNPKIYLAEFKEKVLLNKELSEKFIKEQNERKVREEIRKESTKKKLQEESDEKEKERIQTEITKEREKYKRMLEMVEKGKERRSYLKEMRNITEHEYRMVKSVTPLYKKLEISYLSNVEIPEVENRKEILKKKHEVFKPVDYKQLKEHASNIKKNIKSDHFQNSILNLYRSPTPKFDKSKLILRIIEEDQNKIKEANDKISLKRNLSEKKKNYANIINSVYTPRIDALKQKEMAFIKAKLNTPVTFRKYQRPESLNSSKNFRNFAENTKKFKLPNINSKPVTTVKNYLEDLKAERQRSQSFPVFPYEIPDIHCLTPTDKKTLQKKADFLFQKALKQETKLRPKSFLSDKQLEISDEVNTLLINSIRAKLTILNSIHAIAAVSVPITP